MGILMLLILGFIFWELFKLFKAHNTTPLHTNNYAKKSIEILEERYALGEINKEEFLEKRKLLTK